MKQEFAYFMFLVSEIHVLFLYERFLGPSAESFIAFSGFHYEIFVKTFSTKFLSPYVLRLHINGK